MSRVKGSECNRLIAAIIESRIDRAQCQAHGCRLGAVAFVSAETFQTKRLGCSIIKGLCFAQPQLWYCGGVLGVSASRTKMGKGRSLLHHEVEADFLCKLRAGAGLECRGHG